MNASIQLHYYFILALFAVFLSNINHANSQTVVIPNAQMRLDSLFQVIENQSDKGFIYSEDELNLHQFIELSNKTYELNDLLNKISTTFQVDINLVDNYFIVKVKKQSKAILKQKVQGKLLEFETGNSLPGATILLNQKPISTTNINGEFELFVPVGRVNLAFTYVGFKEATTQLLVNTGQQLYLEIKLEASVSNLQVVNITAQRDRAKSQNHMAYSSGRGFTVLEANRYAGTLGDPARMARSFAGVIPARDDRNDIIIRGNSPTGIQWRVDDIEIPNPNHYGGIGLTGNTTTLLNINLLDDSDFLMGAFP